MLLRFSKAAWGLRRYDHHIVIRVRAISYQGEAENRVKLTSADSKVGKWQLS